MTTVPGGRTQVRGTTGLLSILIFILLITGPSALPAGEQLLDSDVTAHVERAFLSNSVVPFNAIDVTTIQGVVTLSGSVRNLLAKERVVSIAKTVRGVRSVIDRIDISPESMRPATALSESVKDALLYDAATESYEVTVTANEQGKVTLEGEVVSWAERGLAETVAKNVNGVTAIDNEITVVPPSSRSDSEIQKEIQGRLHWDALINTAFIDVKVSNGKVILSGVVGSAAEKERTERNSWVNGVQAIDSSALKVDEWLQHQESRNEKFVKRTDDQIRDAVKTALLYDPRVNLFDIDVSSNFGTVTLRGVVNNIGASKAAIRDARNTVGVVDVNSLVKVRSDANMDDDTIASNIRKALFRNPDTEAYEIDVQVKQNIAYLRGAVDSYFEKAQAENIAARAKGVNVVRNYLTVDFPGMIVYNPYVTSWSIHDYPWYDVVNHAYKSDWQIARDIEDELSWSPFVDAETIDVSVEDGTATLTGTVDSWNEYEAARENALEGGASGVINRLEVN